MIALIVLVRDGAKHLNRNTARKPQRSIGVAVVVSRTMEFLFSLFDFQFDLTGCRPNSKTPNTGKYPHEPTQGSDDQTR